MSYTPDRPPRETAGHPRVVVKLREEHRAPLVATAAPGGSPPGGSEALWERVRQRYPGATIQRAFSGVNPETLGRALREANAAGGDQIPNLSTFYHLNLPAGARASEVMDFMLTGANREQVERAYVDNGTIPANIDPTNDPRFPEQTYVRGRRGAKRGIYANFAWDKPGGDGSNMGIVFVESGWKLDHEDLLGAGIALIAGVNGTDREHGTNVVGEVMGQDNDKGIVGVAPKARCRVISQQISAGNFDVATAIMQGVLSMNRGDVMSISLQTGGSVALGGFRPLESRDLEFWAIKLGTVLGRIVCCAAGNAFIDLDTVTDTAGKFILRRGHADFRDSGAILVAAATATRPHERVSGPGLATNFGSRIDCFAQGRDICTTSTTAAKYVTDFRNTSGATPIVAGAAVLTQGMAKARTGNVLTPAQIRSVLSGPTTSIRSHNPAADRIGRMPNMELIHSRFISTLRAPPAARAHGYEASQGYEPAAYAGRGGAGGGVEPRVFVDAGHGGAEAAGRSSAYGGRGVTGAYEKDVALGVARHVRTHFGRGATLSRDGDYNLSLQQRLAGARRCGAPAFVSVHAHSGAGRYAGPEVWVYSDGLSAPSPHSISLAESIRGEVAAAYGRPVSIREGRIALLQPAYHGPHVAACLVEAGTLEDPEDERRLLDPGGSAAIGAAIARGVHQYVGAVSVGDDDAGDSEDTQFASVHGLGDDQADYASEPPPGDRAPVGQAYDDDYGSGGDADGAHGDAYV